MKTTFATVTTALILAAAFSSNAGETSPTAAGQRPFDQLKSLVGTWQGKTDMGQGPIDMTVRFRLLAGGTVVEERVFEGTPNEMVTMYYEQNGKLALTHYCVMGNRPAMVIGSANGKTIKFDFDKSCGIDTAKESHMHALTMTFDDADTITTSCQAFIGGKEMDDHPTTLKRIKS
ncbi:MAG: hypothetical protein U1G07_26440 [Verrucomicrobiota bacterium]